MKRIKAVIPAVIAVILTACSSGRKTDSGILNPMSETEYADNLSDGSLDPSDASSYDPEVFDKDELIKDIITEYNKKSYREMQKSFYTNGKYMTRVGNTGYVIIYDTSTKTFKPIGINTYSCNGSIYSVSNTTQSGLELSGLCLNKYDLEGNFTDSFVLEDMRFTYFVLSDGRIILSKFAESTEDDVKYEFYVLSADFKTCEKLQPIKTGSSNGKDIYSDVTWILTVDNDELYCQTEDENRYIINMTTGDVRPMDEEIGNELFRFRVQGYRSYIGKYVIDSFGDNVYDIEIGRKYDAFDDYVHNFVTERNFYYTANTEHESRALYRYNMGGDDELIYEAGKEAEFYGVTDDYFTVREKDDILIINMNTLEETPIVLPED